MPSDAPAPELGDQPLSGLRVVSFESRRSAEAARMIRRHGGEPIEAPSLREVPLRGPSGVDALEQDLLAEAPLLLVLLTGVGAALLVEGLEQRLPRERVLELLNNPATTIVCRGPKPYAVLKQLGIKPALVVGEPNTWRDVLRELDAHDFARGKRVYVQEYGRTNEDLVRELEARASDVRQIKTYAWALPEDLTPLRAAIERIERGEAEVALFTSGVQVTHLLQVAATLGVTERLLSGLSRLVIASVGPLTTEALRQAGLPPDLEPEHPKLGHLMASLASQGRAKLAEKRA
jgi:uroporphyrinogen-III synthase